MRGKLRAVTHEDAPHRRRGQLRKLSRNRTYAVCMQDIETKAIAMWSAAVDAALKGGEGPPEGGWDALPEDMKDYYRSLAGGIEKARKVPPV
jgi:hypothetical protein